LNIWKTEYDIKEKQGKYPVIYISFKDAKEQKWKDCLDFIIAEIAALYEKHSYLLEKEILSIDEAKTYREIKNYLYKGVITGILRISRESIFTG
jgi:hypothetical protein